MDSLDTFWNNTTHAMFFLAAEIIPTKVAFVDQLIPLDPFCPQQS
jgi:hypothetical protein